MTFGAKNIWYKVTCRHLIVNLLQNSDFFYSAHNMNSLGVFCFVFVFFFWRGGGYKHTYNAQVIRVNFLK